MAKWEKVAGPADPILVVAVEGVDFSFVLELKALDLRELRKEPIDVSWGVSWNGLQALREEELVNGKRSVLML